MTTEGRFERIEHVTAGLASQFPADREENRRQWRDTQNQIAEVGQQIAGLGHKIDRLAAESVAADKRLEARINQLAEESRAEDKRLAERIESLVSAMARRWDGCCTPQAAADDFPGLLESPPIR